MKRIPKSTADRLRSALAIGLATLLTVSASAQSSESDALRRLQEENAALRKRLALIETNAQPAAPVAAQAQAASPSTAATPSPRLSVDPDVTILSPFDVKSDRDFGYLKINSATATRIGTEIQKVPLNISVISEEFLKDANFSDIQDILRYQSSSAGDTRMGVLQPATGFTPSGNMSLRGFPINSRLRNGLIRYNAYSLDNVERVEVIKGPAAVFFGNAFPGGVINYVTKTPKFTKIPTSITYSYGGWDTRMGSQRVTLDHNAVLSDKAAFRVVGAWDNALGDRQFEFQDGFSVNTGLTLVPLKSGKLRVHVEGEFLQRQRNQDDSSWQFPQGWFDAFKSPPAALIAAAGLSGNADPVGAYRTRIQSSIGNWIADVRTAAGDPKIALWTSPMEHGAYYTDKSGNRVYNPKFSYYGSGSSSDEENKTFSVTTDFSPTEWVDIRHNYTKIISSFDRVISTASPWADGVRFNTAGVIKQGYAIDNYYNQLDAVFKIDVGDFKNKVLVGGLAGEQTNFFTGGVTHANLFPAYGYLPGAYDKPDEGYVSPIPAAFRHPVAAWGVALQYVRDRNGRIITPQQIFTEYDPGVHINPDIRRITEVSRGLVDSSRPKREEYYINLQTSALQDRLTAFVGYREEKTSTVGQLVQANPPWFVVGDFALRNIPESEWVKYGLSAIFSRPRTINGESKMAGISFEVVKNVNLYASYSTTFLPSGVTFLGGDYDPNTVSTRATSLGLTPTTELARLVTQGGMTEVQNETGKNAEFGVKVALNDNKIVGTASVFRVSRENRVLDDTQRQFEEPLNWTGPGNSGAFSRIVRWYSASALQQTEGAEFEVIWTPKRNYQAVVSGSWMWQAETLSDPSLAITPTTTAATIILREIVFANRIPHAPEFRLNLFNKYTFTDNFIGEHGRGFSVGLGARYASEIIISNDVNYNAARGGLTAGDYVVFDSVLSYPMDVFGYQMSASLNVNNVLDKDHSEGGVSLSPPRSWMFTLGMKF